MDNPSLVFALLSTQSPLLPEPWALRLYLDVAWGLVLAAVLLAVLPRRWLGVQLMRWLPLPLVLWCLLPGGVSPAHWLGLALRAPSGLLVVLCVWSLWRVWRPGTPGPGARQALRPWAWPLIALGWLLLLDTFALLPFSLYAWGFAPLLLGGLAALGLLPALLARERAMPVLWMAVLLLFILLRLPTGNVWDAVLDPMLWVWLQVDALRSLRRRV
ncbi:MAG: hypothetical protein ACK5RC_11655 [Curvibacter sp.]|jgi:hypothetical protein|nr:hypothetical protein [Curvibacter sp.]